ncbi:hypothetical protein D9Q98_005880 [Chlorella vulgaris]|uniref:Uncharacterized protein n=1 Tax=Chlorella vulgaris TaxID=3077 RepID=A0A9D4TWJ3_CHLVU|nr:hypothetical protein D9Q98_005880 [Chlorella vulgaris]
MADAKLGGTPPPPPPTAAAAADEAGSEAEESGDEEEEEEGAMSEAFERLMSAAFEMVQQGKPMEAEYVLEEGAKQAEEILGKNALEVAALYDQLCVIRFLYERMEEATEAALRALEILKEHDEGFGPATAIATTRLASTLLAAGQPQEAQLRTAHSIDGLERALKTLAGFEGADEEEAQELSDTKDKFETGLGESRFYHGLARQAQSMSPPAVGQFLEEMRGGLELMQRHLGSESPLIAAALREHGRLIMTALEGDEMELAEALYVQDASLHMAAGGNYEHVALTLYQCGTLQYTMGKYQQAAESLRMSLKTVRQHYPEAAEHLLTVQQRLGMVEALLGRYEVARELLHSVEPALLEALGEANPASEELQFMLSLIALRELEQDGVRDAARQLELLGGMEKHLKALVSYGEEHMLVKKASQLYEEAAAGVQKKKG